MENKVCFVIPTYPARYELAMEQMDSFYSMNLHKEADLVYIFTSTEERDVFPTCKSIVLPKSLRCFKNKGIINIKKYYALMQLKHEYEYIITLDDDSIFIKNVNVYDICKEYYDNKILIGNFLSNPESDLGQLIIKINKKAISYFTKELKEDGTTCLWFNQLCIYSTENLDDFFKITKIDKNIYYLTWFDFDYNIYMQYLLFKKNFEVSFSGIEADLSVSELTPTDSFSIMNTDYNTMKFYAVSSYMQKTLPSTDTFITLHTDRELFERKKSKFNKFIINMKIFLTYFKFRI